MKMIEINETTVGIEIKETLSFEHNVQYIYDNIKDEIQYRYENNEINENDIDGVKEFLERELTTKDKVEILNFIKDDYEYEIYNNEYEVVSIFDEQGIEKSVINWIEDEFEIQVDEI